MKLQNKDTGDVIELPPPDRFGNGVVIFNGRVVERVVYNDIQNSVTTEDGRTFVAERNGVDTWAGYIVEKLESGAYRHQA